MTGTIYSKNKKINKILTDLVQVVFESTHSDFPFTKFQKAGKKLEKLIDEQSESPS